MQNPYLTPAQLGTAPLIGRRDALAEAMQAAREAMQPCGEYRPSFRCEWWLCDLCGHETERKAYRGEADMWEHVATHIPVIDAEALADDEALVEHLQNWVPLGFVPGKDPYENVTEAAREFLRALAAALTERGPHA